MTCSRVMFKNRTTSTVEPWHGFCAAAASIYADDVFRLGASTLPDRQRVLRLHPFEYPDLEFSTRFPASITVFRTNSVEKQLRRVMRALNAGRCPAWLLRIRGCCRLQAFAERTGIAWIADVGMAGYTGSIGRHADPKATWQVREDSRWNR